MMTKFMMALAFMVAVGSLSDVRAEKNDFMEEMNLSAEQKTNLKNLRKKYRKQMEAKRADLKEVREALNAGFEANASDMDLKKSFEKVQAAESSLEALRFERRLEMRKILSEEQRAQFRKMMKERGEKWRERRRHE